MQPEHERWAGEEEKRKTARWNERLTQERIAAEPKKLQAVFEAHANSQRNGTQIASYLLTATLLDEKDDAQ